MFLGISASNWGVIGTVLSALGTLVLTILTFKYVRATKATIVEMKIAREENSKPYVIVDYEVSDKQMVYLYVENLGNSSAFDVTVKITNPIILKNDTDARNVMFDKPINCLVPKRKIKTVIFPTWEIPEAVGKYAENEVEIEYKSSGKSKPYIEKYNISIKPYVERLYMDNYTVHDLVAEAKKVTEHFGIKG